MSEPETVSLLDIALGDRSYCLIQADIDPADDGLVIKVQMSGDVSGEPTVLPWMLISEIPQADNAVARHFIDVWRDQPEGAGREAIEKLADALGLKVEVWS